MILCKNGECLSWQNIYLFWTHSSGIRKKIIPYLCKDAHTYSDRHFDFIPFFLRFFFFVSFWFVCTSIFLIFFLVCVFVWWKKKTLQKSADYVICSCFELQFCGKKQSKNNFSKEESDFIKCITVDQLPRSNYRGSVKWND